MQTINLHRYFEILTAFFFKRIFTGCRSHCAGVLQRCDREDYLPASTRPIKWIQPPQQNLRLNSSLKSPQRRPQISEPEILPTRLKVPNAPQTGKIVGSFKTAYLQYICLKIRQSTAKKLKTSVS